MKVKVAETAGFCFGVKRAVDTVYEQVEKQMGKQIYTYGPIIHNEEVVKDMEAHGVKVLRGEEELKGLGAGSWIRPNGGYFITFKANEGCAKNIVAKAKEAGVVLTGAGAPYPYKKDPKDSVIRIAPTLPPMEELKEACEVFIVCAKLASVEKLLEA